MQLNYPRKNNGMYILRSTDFDPIATLVLKEYCPKVLSTPQPLDIDYLLTECLFLDVVNRYLTYDGKILGLVAFSDAEINCLDRMYQQEKVNIKEGTVIIDSSLAGYANRPRARFTKSHEGSHWILHRSYHDPSHQPYDFRMARKPVIACRTEAVEQYRLSKSVKPRTEDDWEEWQADRLAAAMLMPLNPFVDYAKRAFRHNDIRCGYLLKNKHVGASIAAIEEIAEQFMVSKKAVQIRLKQTGLLFDDPCEVYCHYLT